MPFIFAGNSLSFEVGTKTAFEIPLGNVSHSTVAKNEVTLEFHQNDDAAVGLMEVRFHIPQDKNDESEKDIIAVSTTLSFFFLSLHDGSRS